MNERPASSARQHPPFRAAPLLVPLGRRSASTPADRENPGQPSQSQAHVCQVVTNLTRAWIALAVPAVFLADAFPNLLSVSSLTRSDLRPNEVVKDNPVLVAQTFVFAAPRAPSQPILLPRLISVLFGHHRCRNRTATRKGVARAKHAISLSISPPTTRP